MDQPHVFIEMDVPGSNGQVKHWSVELGSPSILQRSGWKFSDVKPGEKGHRDPSTRCATARPAACSTA
jgi:hypothetical protein